MPNSRPVATDLLAIVQEYLETEISPQVSPVHQFQLKIVSRVLSTVRRELHQLPSANEAEAQRLHSLLRREGTLEDLNAELARAIRAGEFAVDDTALLAHLRASIEDALRINNPKWLAPTA
ncbi:hypothetical protein EZ313_15880 [Ramlibacter henchirensis]|uniref:DUF6285 domain-containing protein n=1 Tax=Ramlibacter henchirensis TaxID=204072 RepID=A0A4Z0BXJ3_9BURK|nr:DUF6285 domain-containing protein [Ramlibacter henchirensis]TFZ02725.1 hypothetical protein EZ313_15880 [Ramlibacter henchirensis]